MQYLRYRCLIKSFVQSTILECIYYGPARAVSELSVLSYSDLEAAI